MITVKHSTKVYGTFYCIGLYECTPLLQRNFRAKVTRFWSYVLIHSFLLRFLENASVPVCCSLSGQARNLQRKWIWTSVELLLSCSFTHKERETSLFAQKISYPQQVWVSLLSYEKQKISKNFRRTFQNLCCVANASVSETVFTLIIHPTLSKSSLHFCWDLFSAKGWKAR